MATPTIDYVAAYATAFTAVGTLALAGATYWLARKTRDLADDAERQFAVASGQAAATADQADASRKLVEVSEFQMRRSQIPVVVPIALGGAVSGAPPEPQVVYAERSEKPAVRVPSVIGRGMLHVPIVNAGVGPAFDIRATFEFLDQRGGPSVAPQPSERRRGVYTALGAGQETELRPVFPDLATPILPFKITVEFADSFGVRYALRATYFPDEQVYRDVVFIPPEGHEFPH